MTDILQAARSYYGLADTESCTTQLFTNQAGQTCVAFEIPLSNEDFAAIVQRMQYMQLPDAQPDTAIIEGPTVEAMREAYNALSKAEKGRYGSFARYMAESSGGIVESPEDTKELQAYLDSIVQKHKDAGLPPPGPDYLTGDGRKVVHVDAPEEPEPVSMDAVWIKRRNTTDAQRQFTSDVRRGDDYEPEYLIQWAMLTDEQKQKAKERGK